VGKKYIRRKDPSLSKKKKSPMKVDQYKHKNKSSTQTPPIARSISNKDRGSTFGKTFNL